MDMLGQIAALAGAKRMARIGYKRPHEGKPTVYLVEPYRLHRTPGGPAVYGWQVAPTPEGRPAWRDFRLDRVTSVEDSGETFEPRVPIELAPGQTAAAPTAAAAPAFDGFSEQAITPLSPADQYFQRLESAMLDGQVAPDELAMARTLAEQLAPQDRKGVHARVFANVLHEVLQDARISHREEIYLQRVREFLEQLGWAP